MGHLLEMTQGSEAAAEIYTDNMEFVDRAEEMAEMGILPEGLYRNRNYAENYVD